MNLQVEERVIHKYEVLLHRNKAGNSEESRQLVEGALIFRDVRRKRLADDPVKFGDKFVGQVEDCDHQRILAELLENVFFIWRLKDKFRNSNTKV